MTITNVSKLVHDIRKSASKEIAINNYTGSLGFTDKWISSIYDSRGVLDEIDPSFDVNSIGKAILQTFGFDESTQTIMWNKWLEIDNDTKAGWIEDFNILDMEDNTEVSLFLKSVSKYLLK